MSVPPTGDPTSRSLSSITPISLDTRKAGILRNNAPINSRWRSLNWGGREKISVEITSIDTAQQNFVAKIHVTSQTWYQRIFEFFGMSRKWSFTEQEKENNYKILIPLKPIENNELKSYSELMHNISRVFREVVQFAPTRQPFLDIYDDETKRNKIFNIFQSSISENSTFRQPSQESKPPQILREPALAPTPALTDPLTVRPASPPLTTEEKKAPFGEEKRTSSSSEEAGLATVGYIDPQSRSTLTNFKKAIAEIENQGADQSITSEGLDEIVAYATRLIPLLEKTTASRQSNKIRAINMELNSGTPKAKKGALVKLNAMLSKFTVEIETLIAQGEKVERESKKEAGPDISTKSEEEIKAAQERFRFDPTKLDEYQKDVSTKENEDFFG